MQFLWRGTPRNVKSRVISVLFQLYDFLLREHGTVMPFFECGLCDFLRIEAVVVRTQTVVGMSPKNTDRATPSSGAASANASRLGPATGAGSRSKNPRGGNTQTRSVFVQVRTRHGQANRSCQTQEAVSLCQARACSVRLRSAAQRRLDTPNGEATTVANLRVRVAARPAPARRAGAGSRTPRGCAGCSRCG